jgi:FkbM family methyltransferase
MPLISLVMPALNAALTLPETLQSLTQQSFKDFELVLINDGSTDATLQIAADFAQHLQIRIISHTRPHGVAQSLNDGVMASDCEWIARLDADDLATPDRLERQLHFLKTHTTIDVCGSAMQVFSSDAPGTRQLQYVLDHPPTDAKIRTALLQRCAIAHPSVLCRRSVFERIGLYDAAFDFAEDYELWCRGSTKGIRFANLPEVLTWYRQHSSQVSHQKAQLQHERDLQVKARYYAALMPSQAAGNLPYLLSLQTRFPNHESALASFKECSPALVALARAAPDAAEFSNILSISLERHLGLKPTASPMPNPSIAPHPTTAATGPVILNFSKGGIGNQLFQHVFARSLAQQLHARMLTDVSYFESDPYHSKAIVHLLDPQADTARIADFAGTGCFMLQDGVIASLQQLQKLPDETQTLVLNGYWQSEAFMEPAIVAEVYAQLGAYARTRVPGVLQAQLQQGAHPIAVHIRRRDYGHMGVCKNAYYLAAIAHVQVNHPDAELFVFSDEPNYARHLLADSGLRFTLVGSGDDLADLYLMSLCRHFVIANSSYSWWAARFGEVRGGLVFCPHEWVTIDASASPCPPRWIQVKEAIQAFDSNAAETRSLSLHIQRQRFDDAIRSWFGDHGDQTLRLQFADLSADSIIFDLGGYQGDWAAQMVARYDAQVYIFEPVKGFHDQICQRFLGNTKVKPFQFGLGAQDAKVQMQLSADGTGAFAEGGSHETVAICEVQNFLLSQQVSHINLMKINIEGGEYDLLDRLIASHSIQLIQRLQIQFHDFVPDAVSRRSAIAALLAKTHRCKWSYYFVWEEWELL